MATTRKPRLVRFTVRLTERQVRSVQDLVRTGRYQSPEEVVGEGLRRVEHEDAASHAADLEALKRKIKVGLDQLERGEVLDGEKVFKDLLRR